METTGEYYYTIHAPRPGEGDGMPEHARSATFATQVEAEAAAREHMKDLRTGGIRIDIRQVGSDTVLNRFGQ